jgi:uncharacterized protein YdhG (YjbR/CyaY superfamily)
MTTKTKQTSSTARFSAEERAAMKERAREAKTQAAGADGAKAVADKIAEMPAEEQALAQAVHDVVADVVPGVAMRTWYGMPAYCRDGKVVVFFQAGSKMKTRYSTVGFSDEARLDDGVMWPTTFALTAWDDATEARVRDLVARAFG